MSDIDNSNQPSIPLERVTKAQLIQTINSALGRFLGEHPTELAAAGGIGIVAGFGPISASGSFVFARLDDFLIRQYFVTDLQ